MARLLRPEGARFRFLIHHIPHRLTEQRAAAVFAAFDAHIHEAFFAVECGVGIEDEAVVGGVRGVAPCLQERVFGGWRFGFQHVDPGAAEVAAGDGVEHGEHVHDSAAPQSSELTPRRTSGIFRE